MTLEKLLGCLTEREREIVRLRYGIGDTSTLTLKEIAAIYGTSEVGIRPELIAAVTKLRTATKNDEQGKLVLGRIGISMTCAIT